MIIKDHNSGTMEVYGEKVSKKATIDGSKLVKLQYILTEGLYSDPMAAVIVEIVNNGMDAVIEAGKNPLSCPVVVKIWKDNYQYWLSIKDEGTGMSTEFFEETFMSMLSSTKEESDTQIGHFGIGGKSWASLGKKVKFTIAKDGKKAIYLCYKGDEFIDFDLLKEETGEFVNGVEFEMPLNFSEYLDCQNKAKQKLTYYDGVALFIDGKMWPNQIYRSELYQWSSNMPYSEIHLCLKDVVYKLDWSKLGYASRNAPSIPISLRFGLNDGITPTPSRENILMNKATIDLIKDRIEKVATIFAEKYNQTVGEASNIIDVWHDLNNTAKFLIVEDGRRWDITDLLNYSSVKPKNIKVKGIDVRDAGWYKIHYNLLDAPFSLAAKYIWNKWHTKYLYGDITYALSGSRTVVLLPSGLTLTGNVREYLKTLYNSGEVLFFKQQEEPDLAWKKLNLLYQSKAGPKATILEWREVLRQLKEKMHLHMDVENEQGFRDFVENRRKTLRDNRAKGITKSSSLNKQFGDVTLGMGRRSYVGNGEAVFDKKAVPVESLEKMKGLIVYNVGEPSEEFKNFVSHTSNITNLIVVNIGKLEAKKLPKSKKIIKFEHFMNGEGGKLFGRICSSMLFLREVNSYRNISSKNPAFVKDLLPKYTAQVEILEKYCAKNAASPYIDDKMKADMLEVARIHNLFDMALWDVYKEVKANNMRYEFIAVFDNRTYNEQDKQKYNRVINQMLLFQKKHYNSFEDTELEIVPKKGNLNWKIKRKNSTLI